ncbi:hypothetical protein CTEN210_01095 [Chaetoceros tenuissimus]|uniref:Glycosyltransferase 2-like domain-containing protein n=1 Tax=Chaetoceros tenuissimus TaxID=426638 RepID=A0AAD3CF19_9STRA|nr:hypothetical protein CTEN210_01095 [Chaetoceros tenuissimus]
MSHDSRKSHLHLAASKDTFTQVESWTDISTLPQVPITILLPAYNEQDRIASTLIDYANYISTCKIWNSDESLVNILVVDDGSIDDTIQTVQRCSETIDLDVECYSLPTNVGKGAALEQGIQYISKRYCDSISSTRLILIADSDGSGDIHSLPDMIYTLSNCISVSIDRKQQNIWNTNAILVGNRSGNNSKSRMITRWGFQTCVKLICGNLQIQDTQCGFKLMTLSAAQSLYKGLNLKRWTHDVEVLYRAKLRGYLVCECPIGWEDKTGSKLASNVQETVVVSLKMLSEIISMRLKYTLGIWKV